MFHSRRSRAALGYLLFAAVGGCDSSQTDTTPDSICLTGHQGDSSDLSSIEVLLWFGEVCGCSSVEGVSCAVSLVDDRVIVQGSAEWTERNRPSCNSACAELVGTCSLRGVPTGEYVLDVGNLEYTLEVPLDEAAFGDDAWRCGDPLW